LRRRDHARSRVLAEHSARSLRTRDRSPPAPPHRARVRRARPDDLNAHPEGNSIPHEPIRLNATAPARVSYAARSSRVSLLSGAPDNGSGGQPPSSDVVHVMQGNSAGKGARPFRTKNLSYHGGKVATTPTVYLVLFGSQWGSDPSGEAPRLVNFLGGLGGSET